MKTDTVISIAGLLTSLVTFVVQSRYAVAPVDYVLVFAPTLAAAVIVLFRVATKSSTGLSAGTGEQKQATDPFTEDLDPLPPRSSLPRGIAVVTDPFTKDLDPLFRQMDDDRAVIDIPPELSGCEDLLESVALCERSTAVHPDIRSFLVGLGHYFTGSPTQASAAWSGIRSMTLRSSDLLMIGAHRRIYLWNKYLGEPKYISTRPDTINDFAVVNGTMYDATMDGIFDTTRDSAVLEGEHFYALVACGSRLYGSGHRVFDILEKRQICDRGEQVLDLVIVERELFDVSQAGLFRTLRGERLSGEELNSGTSDGTYIYVGANHDKWKGKYKSTAGVILRFPYSSSDGRVVKGVNLGEWMAQGRPITGSWMSEKCDVIATRPHWVTELVCLDGVVYDNGGGAYGSHYIQNNVVETMTGKAHKFHAGNVLVAGRRHLYSDYQLSGVVRYAPASGDIHLICADYKKLQRDNVGAAISLRVVQIRDLGHLR